MRLQKATRCALFALAELAANHGRSLSAGEIADRHGVSLNHLAKVLTELSHTGLVAAARGAGGGYRFVGDAQHTTLMDVIALFEPTDPPNTAAINDGSALAGLLDSLEERARIPFLSMTIAEMLRLAER